MRNALFITEYICARKSVPQQDPLLNRKFSCSPQKNTQSSTVINPFRTKS